MAKVDGPRPLTAAQLATLDQLWNDSIVASMDEELEACLALLDQVIELVPTSPDAHESRSNVRKRLGDPAGQAADLARAKELKALAVEHDWPKDAVAQLVDPDEEEVEPAEVGDHTIDDAANLYHADTTAEHLAAAGLPVTRGATGPLRVVAGVRQGGERGFEAIAFGEARESEAWAAATETLVGDPAEQAVAALYEASARYVSLKDAFAEALDGFEEQAGYGEDDG